MVVAPAAAMGPTATKQRARWRVMDFILVILKFVFRLLEFFRIRFT